MICGIYKLSSPSGSFYIGSSYRIPERLRQHRKGMATGRHYNPVLQRAYEKHGPLKEEIILICRKADLLFYEQICIDAMKPNYNNSKIAGRVEMTDEVRQKIGKTNSRPTGRKMTEKLREILRKTNTGSVRSKESREKISRALKGKLKGRKASSETKALLLSYAIGRKVSAEERQVLRDKMIAHYAKVVWTPEMREICGRGNRGKSPSAETREKLRLAGLRRKPSEETRAKLRAARLGSKMSDQCKLKLSVANTGNIISDEVREKISNAHKGRKKTAEHRAKLSAAQKGRKTGIPMSEKNKAALRAANIGRKLSAELVARRWAIRRAKASVGSVGEIQ